MALLDFFPIQRFHGKKIYATAQMGIKEIKKFCQVGTEAIQYRMMDKYH